MTTRFWFVFKDKSDFDFPFGTKLGCGVTAWDLPHAKAILVGKVFPKGLPPIERIVENINIPDLDQNHVIPNMEPPNRIGIWFPIGYQGKNDHLIPSKFSSLNEGSSFK